MSGLPPFDRCVIYQTLVILMNEPFQVALFRVQRCLWACFNAENGTHWLDWPSEDGEFSGSCCCSCCSCGQVNNGLIEFSGAFCGALNAQVASAASDQKSWEELPWHWLQVGFAHSPFEQVQAIKKKRAHIHAHTQERAHARSHAHTHRQTHTQVIHDWTETWEACAK